MNVSNRVQLAEYADRIARELPVGDLCGDRAGSTWEIRDVDYWHWNHEVTVRRLVLYETPLDVNGKGRDGYMVIFGSDAPAKHLPDDRYRSATDRDYERLITGLATDLGQVIDQGFVASQRQESLIADITHHSVEL